jgi:hypothetical protein
VLQLSELKEREAGDTLARPETVGVMVTVVVGALVRTMV